MDKLDEDKRELCQRFVFVTESSENVAIDTLNHFDWDPEAAIDYYFDYMTTPDVELMEELYNKYKDSKVDLILADGITQLCSDLQVDPQDIVMLVISWYMQASTMCEYTKEEFCNGLLDLRVDTLDKFREKLAYIRDDLKDEEKYRMIYNFAFGWAVEKGQKSMLLETAICMWQLLFAERKYPLFDHWIQFLQGGNNKAITRDTWCQLLEFFKQVEKGVADYDADGAWPYLIDEFVEYLNENGIDPSNFGSK